MARIGNIEIPVWHFPIYTSATLVASGNPGLQVLPDYLLRGAFYPLCLELETQNLATDETLDLAVGFYPAADTAWSIGSVTFAQATAGSMKPALEKWPGDITTTGLLGRVPMPPNFLPVWTLAGTTKSMNFILYASGVLLL